MSDLPQSVEPESSRSAKDALARAMAAHRAGDLDIAEEGYRTVLRGEPDHPDALHLLGICRFQREDGREAFDLVSRAVAARPDAAEYHNTLGTILRRAEEYEHAMQSFSRAVRLRPEYRDARNNLALVLGDLRRFGDAETVLRQSLVENPRDPILLTSFGRLQMLTGDFGGAVASLHDALKIAPNHVDTLNNIGVAFNLLEDTESAGAAFERALALNPQHVDAHYNYSHFLLTQGRYAEAWPHFEWRLRRPDYRRRFSVPMWQGEPLEGRTILIWCEQGLGDAIHFIRYAPMVAARGGRVVVECRPPLQRLIAGVDGVAAVAGPGNVEGYALHVPIMSLPGLFKTTVETIPAAVPYVPVPVPLRPGERSGRLRIGLIWAGNPQNARDSARSRRLEEFAPLAALEDVAWFSLQVGAGADDPPPPGLHIINLMPDVKDFYGTAADMAGLDLVISVDSSSAHLAGAIGAPVWVLLDAVADWRWLTGRDDTPWYPTMRLFRRKESWPALFERLVPALQAYRTVARL